MTYEDSLFIKTLQGDDNPQTFSDTGSPNSNEKGKLIVDMMKIGIPARPDLEVKEDLEFVKIADTAIAV